MYWSAVYYRVTLTRFRAVPEVRCPAVGCLEIWTYDDWIASGFFVRSLRIEGLPWLHRLTSPLGSSARSAAYGLAFSTR